MSMNIKNEETHRLARELAGLTGESVSSAVGAAVKERLERVRREKEPGLAETLLTLGREFSKHIKEEYRGVEIDHDAMLYDERGLPK